jgi:UDP-sulfoquinovose synthase
LDERVRAWKGATGNDIEAIVGDMSDGDLVHDVVNRTQPRAIVHCAGQAAAPFSMLDREHAVATQRNHVIGSLNLMYAVRSHCPDAHLIKVGSMGAYGTPNFDIEEGTLEVEHRGRFDRVPFPTRPTSFHHLAQAHESANYRFGAECWGMRVTELKTGVVYGVDTEESNTHENLSTAFHYDGVFGTVLNRFCAQAAAGVPLTVYGEGRNKTAILELADALQGVALALENPPGRGEFRVLNHFTEVFSIGEMADAVRRAARGLGLDAAIESIPNPRFEKAEYHFNPRNGHLRALGLRPTLLSDSITRLIARVGQYRERIDRGVISPTITWKPGGARDNG